MTTDEFAAFYTRWYPDMVRYMNWKTTLSQDAEDLAGSLFAELMPHVDRLDLATADHFMWVAARWVAVHARERHARTSLLTVPLDHDPTVAQRLHASLRQVGVAPEDQVICDTDAVQRELATLPPRERQAIEATVLGNITEVEYAQSVGVSSQRIKQLRRRGLDRLRLARCRAES